MNAGPVIITSTLRRNSDVRFERSHPHKFATYVVLVPKTFISNFDFINVLGRSSLLRIWLSSILIYTALRKVVQILTWSPPRTIASIFFEVIGIMFGGTSPSNIYNRPERILVWSITVYALLVNIIFSTYVVRDKSFTIFSSVTFQTLADLKNSEYELKIPKTIAYGLRYYREQFPKNNVKFKKNCGYDERS